MQCSAGTGWYSDSLKYNPPKYYYRPNALLHWTLNSFKKIMCPTGLIYHFDPLRIKLIVGCLNSSEGADSQYHGSVFHTIWIYLEHHRHPQWDRWQSLWVVMLLQLLWKEWILQLGCLRREKMLWSQMMSSHHLSTLRPILEMMEAHNWKTNRNSVQQWDWLVLKLFTGIQLKM